MQSAEQDDDMENFQSKSIQAFISIKSSKYSEAHNMNLWWKSQSFTEYTKLF